jgi:hypothetical protein
MKILLVHGMGRTPISMWRLARALRQAGCATELFGYLAARQSVEQIVGRLRARLTAMADGDYIVIGHSLGGILLRSAVATLPAAVRRPRRIIMLATPSHSPRMARRFSKTLWYRAINGEAGQWLTDERRFEEMPPMDVPCTVIAGTRGINGRWSPFGDEANDGLVAVTETELNSADELITLPVTHAFIMNDATVRMLVKERCVGETRDERRET